MKVVSLDGPGARTAADRFAAWLAGEGRVARVERTDPASDGGLVAAKEGAATAYRLGGDGWSARGDRLDLDAALDRLAVDHDFALVLGFPEADLPRIAVGEEDDVALLAAETPDALDAGAVLDALENVEPRVTLESLVARVKDSPKADRAGAIATFTGRVREREHEEDAPTTHLEFEKYEGVADERMADLAAELEARDGVYEVAMHHRTGVVESGEDIVFVVVFAGHRREAFRTVEDGIDRLKEEVPIFKKEVTVEDEFWRHEQK